MATGATWDFALIEQKIQFAQENYRSILSPDSWHQKTITFSFPASAYPGTGFLLPDGESLQYKALTQAEKDVALGFFEDIERFIDIDFIYDPTGNGEIKIGHQNMTVGGYAFGPSPGSNHAVLLNDDWVLEEKGYMRQVLIHEVGHALGLPHSQESISHLNPDLDINSASLMASTDLVTNNYEYSLTSYMPLDILALQSLYGVSKVVTNDVYRANGSISVVADYGGVDTIDLSTQAYDPTDINIVDLARGYVYYDRLGGTWQTATYNGATGWSGLTPRSSENGFYNMIIMPGSTIEKVVGSAVSDRIVGTNSIENLIGLAGDDDIKAGGGDDALEGGDGKDMLDGGAGADSMLGGASDDTYFVENAADVVAENDLEGSDRIVSSIDYVLGNFIEILELDGAAIRGTGNNLANSIVGNELDNTLSGGLGKDVVTGGAGADVFGFVNIGEAGKGKTCDTITDFVSGDLIDLSAIVVDGEFEFVGKAKFHKVEGELRAFLEDKRGTAKDVTFIQGDVDGNGKADFQIKLQDLHVLQDIDFVL